MFEHAFDLYGRCDTKLINYYLYNVSYYFMCSLVYINHDSDSGTCEGSLPTVEVALRSRSVVQDIQPFSEWSLVQYYTGERICFSYLLSFSFHIVVVAVTMVVTLVN